jgi:hypothetical protein
MRAHILTLPEGVLEFGKNDTVMVTLVINATEADRICNDLKTGDDSSAASKALFELMNAIADGPNEVRRYNAVHD